MGNLISVLATDSKVMIGDTIYTIRPNVFRMFALSVTRSEFIKNVSDLAMRCYENETQGNGSDYYILDNFFEPVSS